MSNNIRVQHYLYFYYWYPLRKVAHIHVCLSLVDLQGGLSETPFVIKIFKTFSSTSVHYSISVSVVIRRSNNMTSKGRIAQTSV